MLKTLIHCSLLSEAQPLIDFLKLTKDTSVQNLPAGKKLFTNKDKTYLLVISGIGKENCQESLEFIYKNFQIDKSINIGIAGCSDASVKVGTLFCTNRLLPNINFAPITTVDEPLESDENLETLLVDMEAKYFEEISKTNVSKSYIFKVVSDHLDIETPTQEFIIELIEKSLPLFKKYL